MKAETNAANGGIGVSYSNVVLAGGFNPRKGSEAMNSNYRATLGKDGRSTRLLSPIYSKGLEFNAKQKYDFNILNGQSLSSKSFSGRTPHIPNNSLASAGSQMLIK